MNRTGMFLLVLIYLFVDGLSLFCGLITDLSELLQPVADQPIELNPDWLVTAADLNQLSDDIGIAQWFVTEDLPGQHRICRMFQGASWSATPNTAMNCVNRVNAGSSFDQVIESMVDAQILLSDDIELQPTLPHDHDFALYAHQAGNSHAVYDAFLLRDGLLFRASVTLGTPTGYTPETLFAQHDEIIETFLTDILTRNLARAS